MSHKIAAALHQIMEKCAYVQKTGRNSFHNYTYAGEADLLAVLRPAMIDAGLILLPSVVDHTAVDAHGNTTIIIEYTLVHKDGDVWPHKIRAIGTGNDMAKNGKIGDKGTYKALTGANKYLLFKLFQIETGDDPEVDDRKPSATDRDAIAEARKEMDPDGTALSQYEATKAANGGKTPYMVEKEKRAAAASDAGPVPPFLKRPVNGALAAKRKKAEDWIAGALDAISRMPSERAMVTWCDEKQATIDDIQENFPDLIDRLNVALDARRDHVPSVMAAG